MDVPSTMKRIFTLLLLLLIMTCQGQDLLDSLTLATYPAYTDLKVALENPDAVIKLVLKKKKFKEFPIEILKFKNLQYLDISKNQIKELPDSIVTLTKLQYLIVSNTGLERLPMNIGQMKQLRHLNLNQNEIQMLPYSFGSLDNLEYADLWSNNLDVFPETLANLKKLKVMDLRNILIPQSHQDRISDYLPNTLIYFSPPCNCSW